MGKQLNDIAQELKDAKHVTKAKNGSISDVKVQLIYAFNGTGKTRLSREFKSLVDPKSDVEIEETGMENKKILYYNAFTEDLFYWDNDLENDIAPKLIIQPNIFTNWVFVNQGQEPNVISHFQHYTNEKLMPHFNAQYRKKEQGGKSNVVPAYREVTFSYERGDDKNSGNIKISKGEESCFIWCVFYSLLEQVIDVLNIADPSDRETNQFDNLEYIFIDDPVTSLDENHLIELAVDLAELIKSCDSSLKFIITTHNPLFYNVLHNEFKKGTFKKYFLKKDGNGEYNLDEQRNDSPFSYHLYLKSEIEKAIELGQLKKYHYNFLRNILEKTSTFLGYDSWGEILPETNDRTSKSYESRIINISSHSKHSAEEISELSDADKLVLEFLLNEIKKKHNFK